MSGKLALATLLLALLGVTSDAGARTRAPHVSWVKCMSACTDKRTVAPGGKVKIAGSRLPLKGRVVFPVLRGDGTKAVRSMKPSSATSTRIVVGVPANARSGRLYVRTTTGRRSNYSGPIRIRKRSKPPQAPPPPTGSAFDGNGMWIWYVSKANGGDLDAIVEQARAHNVTTVFVKSGDAGNYWTQFSPGLVAKLRAGGLRVCGWQYVYGSNPSAEAAVAARAVTEAGADCFVIDAETEYEGRYSQARTYVSKLRAAAGADFPIGLAAFPYVDYHPAFPYSVFLGPGGAQFNLPQAYWKTIGGGVDAVVNHTYRFNRPYGRTIAPLGQTYDAPPAGEIARFRQLAAAAGATGLSWWSWQHTSAAGWDALGKSVGELPGAPPAFATLARGSKGDLVVWAQQHLEGAGQSVMVDGDFGTSTQAAVKRFQTEAGLSSTGSIDTATWQALLQHAPVAAKWSAGRAAPASAKLRARRYEIPPGRGERSSARWTPAR